jgi:hypothetical protein
MEDLVGIYDFQSFVKVYIDTISKWPSLGAELMGYVDGELEFRRQLLVHSVGGMSELVYRQKESTLFAPVPARAFSAHLFSPHTRTCKSKQEKFNSESEEKVI